MAFGFPAYYKDRKNLKFSTDKTKNIVLKVLEILGWQEIGLHPYALDYKTIGTMLTTGERVYINITDTEIIIRSECLFPTRIIDFGKNKFNINKFWAEYDKLLKPNL